MTMTDQDRLRALEAENVELRADKAFRDLMTFSERAEAAEARVTELAWQNERQRIKLEEAEARVTVLEAALRQLRGDMRQRSADTKVVRDEEPDARYTPAVFTAFIEELDKWTNDIATLLHPEGSPAPEGP